MANIWDEYERDLFSEKKKKDEKPASSNIWDDLEQEHFNPKPQAGLTSSQISSSVDRYQAGLYGVGEAVAEGVGAKDSAEWLKAQREENEFLADKASKRARDLGAVDRWDDVHGVGDFGSYAKGLAIQSLPYAAEALAGGVLARGAMSGTRAALTAATAAKDVEGVAAATKALNAGSQAGAVAASYPSAVGDVLGNQREQSNGETRGGVAAALAVPYAALNAFGVEGALARGTAFKNTVNILDRGTGLTGGAARMAATGAGVALKEGASETGQEMLNQVGRMSVDANEDFLSAAAQERFKESFIGGATLGGLAGGLGGGWRRSEGGNELSQAMGNKAVNQPDITTTQFVPPAAPPVAPAEITPTTTDTVASEQQVPPTAPAVSGGTTDIAAAQQQAQADQQAQQVADQQAQQAQALQERRDTVAAYFGAEPTLDNGQHVGGMIMGKAFTDPAKYNAELDKLAANEDQKSELRRKVEAAYMQTLPAEKRKLAAIQGGALKFWTNKPDLAAVAEGINTAMTELVAAGKGTNDAKLTQMAQMYEALTGQEAPAYAAAQQVQPKGAKNDKLQLQTTTGLGTVPVEGGTTEAVSGAAGDVRPAQVQPVGATSVGAGPSDVQAGQPSTGGVRPSAGDVSSVVGGEATPQVSEATDGQTQTTTGLGDGGQVSGQTGQVADVSVPPTTGGTTEAVPAASAEKIEHDGDILSNLYRQVLTPTQEKRGGATLEQRIEMVRLALIEQASEAEIAELTGLSLTTVDAQLRRLGVVMRPQYSQANLDTRAAIAERLGISAEVLAGVEDVTVEGVARPSKEQKQAAQAKYLSDSITADVAPEDRARSVSRLMATYAATGEQYECVTPKAELQRGKLKQFERLDVLFQRAADAYTSPEFPQGIPRRDLLELVTPRRVITLKDSISDQQRAEFEGESQDFDNTKYLSEELYGGEEQEGKSMGTVASAGGSQGSVETQRKADLGKIEKLQTQMGKLAADDVEGRAAIQKQLNIEYAKYHVRTLEAALANLPKPSEMTDEDAALKIKLFTQLDAARAEFAAASAGESTTTAAAPKNEVSDEVKAVKAKFKETKGDLTKFDMGELQLLLDEANKFKNMALAKKLDAEMAGRTTTTEPVNAVQEPSPAQVPVQERAGSSETVGQGDTEGGQAAAEGEVKAEQEEVIKTPAEQWADLAAQFPAMPSYESLSKDAKIRWDDVATRGVANLAAADKILNTAVKEQPVEAPSTVGTTEAVTESNVGMATELTPEQAALVEGPVSELTEGQTIRLEKHYDAKRGTSEFLTKLHGDIALYAAKGAAAVHAAIRDIVKALYTAVLAVAVVFNPTYMNKVEAFTVSPAQEYSVTQEVKAEAPAEAAVKMSTAAKQAYATLMPALKADLTAKNKLLVMADKPSGRIFVFTPDGKLVLEKKSLFGLAKGDFYKGNNDLPANRITPAGLHNLVMVDAAKGGAAAKTAGEYDFGKVFGIVDENPGVLTIMHSVWLHENDAAKRTAALKNDNAADSRYSFGCINVDKATYKNLIDNYGQQMDGAKLFVVPDNQERVMDFVTGAVAQNKTGEDKLVRQSVQPVTTTTTGNRQGVTQASTERNIVGKEENGKLSSKSKPFAQYLEFDELDTYLGGMDMVRDQLTDAGIPDAINLVSDWELIDDPSDTADHGSLRTVQGRYVGTLNVAKLDNAGYAAETARHEIAHAIDMGPHGGIYSAQPEMGVSVVDGVIRAEGPVAKELYALYENNADWNNFLAYPFNSDEHPDLNNRTKVQLELFAQAFSVYTTPQGRARMEADAPITAAYFKEVIQDVKSTKPLQIQKAEIAALRTAVLYTRRESKGNRGPSKVLGLDERIDELLASRSRQSKEGLENTLPASVTKPAKSVVTNLATAAKNGLLAAGITEDIVNMAGKHMRSAQDYLTAQYARQKTRLDFEQRIEHILDAFDKLPKHLQGEGAGSVNRFILDSTMSKKWGFYPGEHRIGTTLFEVDPELSRRFFAIEQESPAAAQVIRDVFEHGYQALKAKKEAIDAAVEREFAERAKAADGDADLMAEVAQAKKLMRTQLSKIQNVDFTTPYAYLGRYGDYVVAAKSAEFKYWEGVAAEKGEAKDRAIGWLAENVSNPDHYVVQFAETQGEADQIAADLMATGKFDMDGSEAGPKEDIGSFIGSDVHLAVARLRNLIARQEGESGEGNAELDRMVSDLYLMTAAENSARKSEIMRKYVSGANANMMRNLATSGRADAHFLSTMKHNDEVVDSLERMRTEAKRNVREAMPLYNELYKRQTASLEYKTPSTLSQALTQATTLWFLSTSPAFYLQQLLQTTVLSLPYMSGRLGYFRSVRAIKGAYSDVATMVKGLGTNAHIDFSKAPEDVRAMLQTLVGMGKIDIGIDADAKARAGEHNVLNTVMRKLQGVNNRIEAINRSTAAIAAYRGYIQRYGAGDTAAATKFAADVVSNTHGSYDGFNTPRILNSDTGRLVGQFKRFQIIQLSMLGKLIHGAFKGANSDERLVARRALAFITGHMAVVGGALGVPFVQQVASLLLTAFGDDDEPKDLEYKLRQAIGDDTTANLLLNGVPSALGVNLGGKLGMGNVASLLPFTDVDLSTRSGYEKVVVGLMGPFFGGLAPKFADGAGMIAKGEYYKGLELLMPNGIGNAMKGARFASEGVTMRNGDVVLKPEEISMVDAAFQAVGLPTNTITHRQYTQKVAIEFDKFYTERAASIKGAYVNANRDGDTEGMAEARKDWEELQASRKRNGYTIQPMSELFRATVAARKREASTVGGVETTKANKQFVKNII